VIRRIADAALDVIPRIADVIRRIAIDSNLSGAADPESQTNRRPQEKPKLAKARD
jgi:hypothetical protein